MIGRSEKQGETLVPRDNQSGSIHVSTFNLEATSEDNISTQEVRVILLIPKTASVSSPQTQSVLVEM
ncbi:hypothetical protein R1flu_007775 [Riccia fluitans]|uniref:Uncharacterized protein n=1 Tax=Riccia fluitans TaxID=41844 RepID=A0ABD1YZW5_9MARC